MYVAVIELAQRLRLTRDGKVELSMPTTWSERRFGIVPSDHSATRMSCTDFRDLAHWFGALWKGAND